MKAKATAKHMIAALTMALTLAVVGQATASEPGKYLYLVVSGTYTDSENAYVSGLMYYPGNEKCGDRRDIDFVSDAKRGFGSHLEARHTNEFPNGPREVALLDRQLHSYDLIETRQQGEERLNAWVADEKRRGRHVIFTRYSYRCN